MGKKKNTVEDIPELTPEELEKIDRYAHEGDSAELMDREEHGNSGKQS